MRDALIYFGSLMLVCAGNNGKNTQNSSMLLCCSLSAVEKFCIARAARELE
jgi:hypothetical protein